MRNVLMWAYDVHSESAELLREYMGILQIRHEGSTFKGGRQYTIVNWGSSDLPLSVRRCGRILNSENAVYTSANKVRAFKAMARAGVRTVPWTQERREAAHWLDEGHTVYARLQQEGKDGEGIQVVGRGRDLPECRLYTKYVPPTHEYRFHVVNGRVVAAHRKVQDRQKIEQGYDGNAMVKNSKNGWVFKRVTIYDQDLPAQAIGAIRAVGLDYGAVDLIWDGRQAYVLETNTAPAINEMQWTCQQYADAITAMIPEEARG